MRSKCRPEAREFAERQGDLFASRGWGGARKGAGRKRTNERIRVPHRPRGKHHAHAPVQITLRLHAGLPSLRTSSNFRVVQRALENAPVSEPAAKTVASARGRRARGTPGRFQVVHYSVQTNHLHLIVEAKDSRSLSEGMKGLMVRIARALNRHWSRRGPVFGDRHHHRELRSPREVRNSLVYVLQNARRHGIHLGGPDPFSSAPFFDGWTTMPRADGGRIASRAADGGRTAPRAEDGCKTLPRTDSSPRIAWTWLLSVGWRKLGRIGWNEGQWPSSKPLRSEPGCPRPRTRSPSSARPHRERVALEARSS